MATAFGSYAHYLLYFVVVLLHALSVRTMPNPANRLSHQQQQQQQQQQQYHPHHSPANVVNPPPRTTSTMESEKGKRSLTGGAVHTKKYVSKNGYALAINKNSVTGINDMTSDRAQLNVTLVPRNISPSFNHGDVPTSGESNKSAVSFSYRISGKLSGSYLCARNRKNIYASVNFTETECSWDTVPLKELYTLLCQNRTFKKNVKEVYCLQVKRNRSNVNRPILRMKKPHRRGIPRSMWFSDVDSQTTPEAPFTNMVEPSTPYPTTPKATRRPCQGRKKGRNCRKKCKKGNKRKKCPRKRNPLTTLFSRREDRKTKSRGKSRTKVVFASNLFAARDRRR